MQKQSSKGNFFSPLGPWSLSPSRQAQLVELAWGGLADFQCKNQNQPGFKMWLAQSIPAGSRSPFLIGNQEKKKKRTDEPMGVLQDACNRLVPHSPQDWMAFLCGVSPQKPHKPVPRKVQKQNGVVTCVWCVTAKWILVFRPCLLVLVMSNPRAVTQPAEGWWSECTLTQSQRPLG